MQEYLLKKVLKQNKYFLIHTKSLYRFLFSKSNL
jgi:hypothetical protein